MKFRGSFVPLITPFDRKGRVDSKKLEQLVTWHITEGSDGIVCSATTGEGVSLSDSERKKIATICIQTAARKVPIIVSTGINDTKTSVRFTEVAQKLGADGCLVVTPYYNRPTQRGCFLHFQEIDRVALPIIAYHNPARTAVRLTPETVREISTLSHVVGMKDSSHDLDFVRKVVHTIPLFSGEDDLTFQIMKEGGVGSIVVTPNLIPRGWKQMIHHCLNQRWAQAEALSQRYLPLNRALFLETNPQCVKWALAWLGRCIPAFRLPLIPPTEPVQVLLKKELLRLALPHLSSVISSAM